MESLLNCHGSPGRTENFILYFVITMGTATDRNQWIQTKNVKSAVPIDAI